MQKLLVFQRVVQPTDSGGLSFVREQRLCSLCSFCSFCMLSGAQRNSYIYDTNKKNRWLYYFHMVSVLIGRLNSFQWTLQSTSSRRYKSIIGMSGRCKPNLFQYCSNFDVRTVGLLSSRMFQMATLSSPPLLFLKSYPESSSSPYILNSKHRLNTTSDCMLSCLPDPFILIS